MKAIVYHNGEDNHERTEDLFIECNCLSISVEFVKGLPFIKEPSLVIDTFENSATYFVK